MAKPTVDTNTTDIHTTVTTSTTPTIASTNRNVDLKEFLSSITCASCTFKESHGKYVVYKKCRKCREN
jgi:hypothetical protein